MIAQAQVKFVRISPIKARQVIDLIRGKDVVSAQTILTHVNKGATKLIGKVLMNCRATIGQIGNVDHESVSLGKAGRRRWMGHKGKVRGVVMNPHDHPHGGGEGKTPQGNPHPVTPWGKVTKGLKTRTKQKYSNQFIVRRRGSK